MGIFDEGVNGDIERLWQRWIDDPELFSAPRRLYHYGPSQRRTAIASRGLLCSQSELKPAGYPFVFLTSEGCGRTSGRDVWEVDAEGLDLVPDGTTMPGNFPEETWWMARSDVPAARLILIHRG